MWLTSDNMPDWMRPDISHLYAVDKTSDGYIKLCVDPGHPRAWRDGAGKQTMDAISECGSHIIVQVGHQINFVKGKDKELPRKIILDWTL